MFKRFKEWYKLLTSVVAIAVAIALLPVGVLAINLPAAASKAGLPVPEGYTTDEHGIMAYRFDLRLNTLGVP